ncbi:hypothetical protein HDU67_006332 [Dinochytrium kinnereticum]|nr:hypothetical protein HDU67_006332 [Dinochytrium kinnereticum]
MARPIDVASTAQVQQMLSGEALFMLNKLPEQSLMPEKSTPFSRLSTINNKADPKWQNELPNDIPTLRAMCFELIEAQDKFQDRCRETILQLIEEKHIALCKNRLMEIRLNMLEMGAVQQEEYYRKNLADLTKQHTEQLQAIFRRNEETEKAFLAYQKAHSEEFAELSRLRAEIAAWKGRGIPGASQEMQSVYSQLQALKKDLSEAQAEKKSLEERLKLSEKLKNMTERENAEIRADVNKLRKTLQEEASVASVIVWFYSAYILIGFTRRMINQLQGARREQDEKDESLGSIIFIKGEGGSKRIKGATPEKLVERLVDPTQFDNQFLQVFMLTYKVYMSSRQLMDSIVRIFKENTKAETVAGEIGLQPPILLRIVNTMKFWLENYWVDFQEDPSLLKELTNFIDKLQDEKLITKRLSTDQIKLNPSSSSDQKGWVPFAKKMSSGALGVGLAGGSPAGSPSGVAHLNYEEEFRFRLGDLEPLEIARQITLIESELFLSIQVREFLDLAWMKEDKEIRAPNITRMIQWSNHAIHWIVSEIVSVRDSMRMRAQMFEKFIQVAQHLDKLNNFNGVKEVLAALQSSSVYRLKKTKELVANKYLRIYEDLLKLISSELNYKALRAKVHAAEPPLIPFPGVYQGDLVFLDTCSKDILENGLVNFHKFQKVASYILEIQNYQQARYSLEPVSEIQEYIRNYPILDDDQAYTQSLACEARG